MERIVGRWSDIILSQNREDIQTAIDEDICKQNRIEFLGNGIDINNFNLSKISEKDKARKRKEIGLPEGKKIIGFVGRLVIEKGVLDLINAAKVVVQDSNEVHFLFVGPIDHVKKDAIHPQRDAIGVSDFCSFIGFQEDMPIIYSLMDVFVLVSYREGFPRSLMEASAMQVPCIATDIRGCREVVEEGKNGLLIPLGDPQALTQAILKLLKNPALARKMGNIGRQMAIKRFDEQEVFTKVIQTYQTLLEKKGLLQEQI